MTYQLALLFGAVQGLTEFCRYPAPGISPYCRCWRSKRPTSFYAFPASGDIRRRLCAYRKEILALIKEFFRTYRTGCASALLKTRDPAFSRIDDCIAAAAFCGGSRQG